MNVISRDRLLLMLSEIRGASFATITTRTDARLRKTGNPFGHVEKISRVNVTLGFQYTSAVNRQRKREEMTADFVAMPRQWGKRHASTPLLIEHKGKFYLETKVERSLSHEYRAEDGTILADEQAQPFLPSRGSSRQELTREILVRDYAIDSIIGIAFNGQSYMVAPATERKAA